MRQVVDQDQRISIVELGIVIALTAWPLIDLAIDGLRALAALL